MTENTDVRGQEFPEPEAEGKQWILRLYVAGQTPKSIAAFANLKKMCDEQLSGHYDLEVIDIYQHPELMQSDQIVATPPLVKKLPPPLKKLIGDMTDKKRVIVGLDLHPRQE